MKFSYTLLKRILPELSFKSKTIEILNLYVFESDDLGGDSIDISLPANRYSDASSHLGIARELSVVLNKKIKNPVKLIVNQPSSNNFIQVKVEDKNLCPRYLAYYFEIPKVGESNSEIKKILKSCGINPINNVVDIANLVMLETGQPLHIFDADKLDGGFPKKIIVRKAKKGEVIETLDNQKFRLKDKDLVISDIKNPLAIAGIKGGKYSGVTKSTKRIILEAANFDPVSIYHTSKSLNLKTDASIRFSHGLSPELVKIGADRAVLYLKQLGGKLLDSYDSNPKKFTERIIDFNTGKYEKFIGEKVELKKAKNYFEKLGFFVKKINGNTLRVYVPSWRLDLEDFEDLAEEVMRFGGINNLKPQKPVIELNPHKEENIFILKDKIRMSLQKLGLSEVYTHSLISEEDKVLSELNLNFSNRVIEILYPVSKEFKYLRPSLFMNLKNTLLDNSRFFNEVKIFEIGKVFYKENNNFKEELKLGCGILYKKDHPIFELKGVFSSLLEDLGIDDYLMVEDDKKIKIEVDGEVIGNILHFKTKKGFNIALAEINLEKVLKSIEEEKEFKPLPKYPAVLRDISILVSKDFKIGEIMEKISNVSSILEDVDLIDEYWEQSFSNNQSLTFRLIFQSEEKTLKDEEIDEELKKIKNILHKDFKAQIR
jgi:phenylalanyl-tRNA synthetase beta chain